MSQRAIIALIAAIFYPENKKAQKQEISFPPFAC